MRSVGACPSRSWIVVGFFACMQLACVMRRFAVLALFRERPHGRILQTLQQMHCGSVLVSCRKPKQYCSSERVLSIQETPQAMHVAPAMAVDEHQM